MTPRNAWVSNRRTCITILVYVDKQGTSKSRGVSGSEERHKRYALRHLTWQGHNALEELRNGGTI